MSSKITYTCEWCGKEHHSYSREIECRSGNTVSVRLSDLCPDCYNKLVRAFWNRREIVTKKAITSSQWIGSVFVALALGAFICYVIMTMG